MHRNHFACDGAEHQAQTRNAAEVVPGWGWDWMKLSRIRVKSGLRSALGYGLELGLS